MKTHPPPKSTIIFVVNSLRFFESHRLPLGRAALSAGYRVVVAAPDDGANPQQLLGEGFVLAAIPMARRMHPWHDLRAIRALVRLFRRERPDLVHLVTLKAILTGGAAARLTRVPAVVHAVTGLGHMFGGEAQAKLSRLILLKLGLTVPLQHPNCQVICQNPEDAATLQRLNLSPSPAIIRGSGVDTRKFSPKKEPSPPFTVTLASRLLEGKGIREFVDAAKELRFEDVKCILAGAPDPGNPTSLDEAEVHAWHRAGHIQYLGPVTDMPSLLASSHVVVLPSRYGEGVPKVLLEAASCGRPMVGTEMPGIREIVVPGVTGVLVPPGDSAGLASAVLQLKANSDMREKMGAAARQLAVASFDERAVARETESIWQNLLAVASRR